MKLSEARMMSISKFTSLPLKDSRNENDSLFFVPRAHGSPFGGRRVGVEMGSRVTEAEGSGTSPWGMQ